MLTMIMIMLTMTMARLSCYPIVHCLIALPTPPFDFEASSLVRFSFDDISNGDDDHCATCSQLFS